MVCLHSCRGQCVNNRFAIAIVTGHQIAKMMKILKLHFKVILCFKWPTLHCFAFSPVHFNTKQSLSCSGTLRRGVALPPSPSMSMLQASPSSLSSVSVCSGLLSNGQLSQRSPTPSRSESNCRGLYTRGQLSCVRHTHERVREERQHCVFSPCLFLY